MTYIINTGLLSSICAICILATVSVLNLTSLSSLSRNSHHFCRSSTLLCQTHTSFSHFTRAIRRVSVVNLHSLVSCLHSCLAGHAVFFNALLAMLNARGKLSGPGFTDSGSGGSSAFSHGTGKVVNMLRLSAVGGGRGGKKSDMRFARPSLGHTFSSKDTGVSTGESELPEMFAMSERKVSSRYISLPPIISLRCDSRLLLNLIFLLSCLSRPQTLP